MEQTDAPLIIVDGDLTSLVALACSSDEAVSLGSKRSSGPCALAWMPPVYETTERERSGACDRQTSLFNARRLSKSQTDDPLRRDNTDDLPGTALTQILFTALIHANKLGCSRIIWPKHPGRAGDDTIIDLDLASSIIDRSFLVEQLTRLDSMKANERIRIETPHADLSDRQLVEIATDLSVPIKTLWWWGSSADEALIQRERWQPLMEETGLWRSAERRAVVNR